MIYYHLYLPVLLTAVAVHFDFSKNFLPSALFDVCGPWNFCSLISVVSQCPDKDLSLPLSQKSSVQLLSRVWLFATPWITACSLNILISATVEAAAAQEGRNQGKHLHLSLREPPDQPKYKTPIFGGHDSLPPTSHYRNVGCHPLALTSS